MVYFFAKVENIGFFLILEKILSGCCFILSGTSLTGSNPGIPLFLFRSGFF